jgi:amidohydrolase
MTSTLEIELTLEEMKAWRHALHRHPELSTLEYWTSEFVATRLTEFGLEVHRGIGATGVVGVLRGDPRFGRAVGLRADMDALPIEELNEFAHRSTIPGQMHACGHDGHTTMLLGAARHLAGSKPLPGTIYFIFQPAEESATGSRDMIRDGLFEKFPMQEVYGLHNLPGLPLGHFALRSGAIMAATDHFSLSIRGLGGHAALPHQTRDPIVASAQVVMAWQTIVSRRTNPLDSAVLSVTQIHGGGSLNAIPSEVTLAGTVRSFDEKVRDALEAAMSCLAESICEANNVECTFTYHRKNPATVNTGREMAIAAQVAKTLVGDANVNADASPLTAGEDFAWMLKEKPGCFAFIGNGSSASSAALHNARYDFNDETIVIGVRYWVELARTALNQTVS